ncbi:activating transcription factor 7-interacting protein 1-like isoform X1 [Scleropages formosus]|uniref:Activating transcription factor 7 interacting protein n=2 Tax=Scleropages formosus TaxID=113540 RepID=A0A8C9V334_SCLFO|nr:activating transcription factor 7-interacting protein 1 isoform X1 [Scleropages formosus]XP_018593953.1 activating transcription factor 7-interacting protein 1 isoform X1 [Scleropages formosus]
MDVAVPEEPQKKIFRARKTMKLSDRQQLESLHNILPSSFSYSSIAPTPLLINKKPPKEGQLETGNNKENEEGVASNGQNATCAASTVSTEHSTPTTLSLSLSPSPVAKASSPPPMSPSLDPFMKDGDKKRDPEGEGKSAVLDSDMMEREKKEGWAEGNTNAAVSEKEDIHSKPDPRSILTSKDQDDSKNVSLEISETTDKGVKKTVFEEIYDMDREPLKSIVDDAALTLGKTDTSSLPEFPIVPSNTTSSSPSLSPSHALESDQEVKEGFLVLSDEDESQGDRDEEKEMDGEMMNADRKEMERKDQAVSVSSPTELSSSANSGRKEDCDSGILTKKRAMLSEGRSEEEGCRKRPKVEKGELEAQLELRITGDTGIRQRLEKVVQHLVAEQLQVLQLTVFDKSLQELRERVDKIDCATKHQQTLNMLQAKIARLTKKFVAANQAKENAGKSKEVSPISSATASAAKPTSNTALTCRTMKGMLETHQAEPHCQSSTLSPVSCTGIPNQRKPAPVLTTPSAPVPAPGSPSSVAPPSSLTNTAMPSSQSGTLMLKASSASAGLTPSAPMSASTPISLQPLLIQLPLAVSNPQVGHTPGVELIPFSSLAGTTALSKAKTTAPSTAIILQKSLGATATSSASIVPAPPAPPAPSLPQITLARGGMPSGGSGIISVPSPGVSVSTARTPTPCISVVGVTSSSSLPTLTSSVPAATGSHSSGLVLSGPVSAAVMASKTDNQATNRATESTTARMPAQASRTHSSGPVIDLTEDDDDVQAAALNFSVTGVKRVVHSNPSVAASSSSLSSAEATAATQRTSGPPPLISSCSAQSQPAVRSPQSQPLSNGPQVTVHHRPQQESQLKRTPNAPTSSTQQSLIPPLPPPPTPPARLPPEAAHSSPPQQPQLKLARVESQNGIVLSWSVAELDHTCAAVDSYHLYAYHQDHSASASSPGSQWKKIGEVKALALPMACTLTQFVSGSKYYFAVHARDVYGRFGPFCEPQCTDVIPLSSSS